MEHISLDTNILLLDANNLTTVGDDNTIIILPETVLDEIDSKKSGEGELAYQARAFGRLLSKAKKTRLLRRPGMIIQEMVLYDTIIHIVSLDTYNSIEASTPLNITNDNKIIEGTLRYSQEYSVEVTFMTNDVMCGVRAGIKGLNNTDLKIVEKTSFNLVKELEVDSGLFANLHGLSIQEVDPEYILENYNYKFHSSDSNQVKLATISPLGVIDVIDKKDEITLANQPLPPINAEQKMFSKAILDQTIDIVACESKAGSGKTAIALSNAMRLVSTNSPYNEIIYIRNTVNDLDKEEEVGFLPGLEEKFALYYEPLEDTLDTMARRKIGKSKLKADELEIRVDEEIQSMKNKYNIQAMSTMGLRGRTLKNSVLILDEFQNLSKGSAQKVLTRIGDNCKVIILGSNKQIDNAFITKYNNGLSVVLNDVCTVISDSVNKYAISLKKVVRSHITEWAEDIFTAAKD